MSQGATEPTLYEVSMHEAAHAVAAARFGHEFDAVTMVADDDTLGQVLVDTPQWVLDADLSVDARARRFLEEACIIALIGERVGRRVREAENVEPLFSDDDVLAWMNLVALHPEDEAAANATMSRLEEEADALAADSEFVWSVERVAVQLRARGTLPWRTVLDLTARDADG